MEHFIFLEGVCSALSEVIPEWGALLLAHGRGSAVDARRQTPHGFFVFCIMEAIEGVEVASLSSYGALPYIRADKRRERVARWNSVRRRLPALEKPGDRAFPPVRNRAVPVVL